jgi:hypothetical protein
MTSEPQATGSPSSSATKFVMTGASPLVATSSRRRNDSTIAVGMSNATPMSVPNASIEGCSRTSS